MIIPSTVYQVVCWNTAATELAPALMYVGSKNVFHIIYSYEDIKNTTENIKIFDIVTKYKLDIANQSACSVDSENINFGKLYSTTEFLIKK